MDTINTPNTINVIAVYKFRLLVTLLNNIFPNRIRDTRIKNTPITKFN